MKNFSFSKSKGVIFPFCGPKGIVLESENIFLLERKEDDLRLLGGRLFFGSTVFFGGGKMKVGGWNLRMAGTFS